VLKFGLLDFALFFSQQHSWTNFIYTRCQNVNRKSKGTFHDDVACTPSKKHRPDPEKHKYPSLPLDAEDDTATERSLFLLKQELSKSKPNTDSVMSLMKHTFTYRRQQILGSIEGALRLLGLPWAVSASLSCAGGC